MILYSYRTPLDVQVSLSAESPGEYSPVKYLGMDGAIALTKLLLRESLGAYGHTIDPDNAPPMDINAALYEIYGDDLEQLSPAGIVSYDIGPNDSPAGPGPGPDGDRTDADPIIPTGRPLSLEEVRLIVASLDTQEQIDAFLATAVIADEDEPLVALLTSAPTEIDLSELVATTEDDDGLLLVALALAGSYALMRLVIPLGWADRPYDERRQRATAAIAAADRIILDGEALAQHRNGLDLYYRDVTRAHATALTDGAIDLEEYHRRMVSSITEAHTVQRRLGQGGLSAQARNSLQATLDEQLGYLGDMVGAIERGELSAAQLIDRSGRYGGNGGLSFNEGMAAALALDAATEQRFLGACSPHCQECVDYAGRGRVPVGMLPRPRQQCSCRSSCCCRQEFYDLSDRLVGVIG
jgi:hypothetical protein